MSQKESQYDLDSGASMHHGDDDDKESKGWFTKTKIAVIGAIVIVIIVAIVLGVVQPWNSSDDSSEAITEPIPTTDSDAAINTDATAQVPSAGGYSIQSRSDTPNGEKITLALAQDSTAANVHKDLELEVIHEDADRLHVRILATGAENYELPPDASPVLSKVEEGVTAYNYDVSIVDDIVTVTRVGSARRAASTLVTINLLDLIYNDQYIRLPLGVGASPYIVGLSEHYTEKLQVEEEKVYTMWNTDQYSCPMYTNLYGSHPHYVQITDDGLAHGVYVRNGFGQDWQLQGEILTGHMVGGIVDMYVFTGPTVDQAGQQYAKVIGTNFMPPYWSLGWQQSRYGMENISMVQRTIDGYIDQQIPLEVIYTDIDYMDGYKDFTSDPVAFPQVEWRAMVQDVQAKGRKYIIIKDPAISTDFPEYPAYKRGIADDVFVKYADGSGDYHARQWVGTSLVVDPTAANAESWWSTEVKEWWSTTGIPFDGMWIDMNEFANFCQGESNTALPKDWLSEYNLLWSFPCYTHTEEEAARLVNLTAAEALGMNNDDFTNGGLRDYTDPLNNPPYNIMNSVAGTSGFSAQQGELSEMEHNAPEPKPLVFKTLDMTAMFASGGNEYQMHNAYGLYIAKMGKAAVDALDANKRGFLLTRSTFPGSGHYSGHWTGDVQGDWLHMRAGIHASIQNTVNGILYIGDDSCGFVNDESQDQDMFDEMCARWTSVSAFFPFARNHYSKGHPKKHEPWERPVIAAAAKTAIEYRNEITPYMYTLFYKAHMGTGSLVLAAPSFYYPSDATAKATQDQFMVGPALMVAPALYENMTEVPVYFPDGNKWYDWHTGAPAGVTANPETFASTVDAANVILLFGAGGHIVPKQPSSLTLKEARLNPVSLIAMMDSAGTAEGSIYWDDGEGKDLNNSIVMSYTASATSFEAKANSSAFTGTPPAVAEIKLYGITAVPTTTTVTIAGAATPVTATYDAALQVLTIPLTGVTLSTAFTVAMVGATSHVAPASAAGGTDQVPSAGGYSIQSRSDTPNGEKITLALAQDSTAANVHKDLELEVIHEDANRLHVRILATGAENYELPPDASPVLSKVEEDVTAYNYDISVDNDVVTIRRAATARRDATTLVTINLLDLIYNEQYIRLPLGVGANPYIVGLSEHYTEKLQVEEDKIYTMWNTDQYSCPMYTNLYGSHPHYVQITDDGLAHGVYVRNGFGQDWQLRGETLTGHMVGGIVDMYVFTGPTVESAGQQYAQVIGTNFMPPYWSLGWQQSRYGMENISMVQRTIDGYIDQQIPLEVIYTDIDYMDGYKDFTSDPVAFPQVEWRAMVEDVQAKGRKYIIIKDPAISTDFPEYPAYKRGIADDVFVKYADGSGDYHARQWVGTSLVVDPTAANAESWWSTEVTEWWSTTGIPFDGMWIDMNEFANFCQGESNTALPKDWLSEYNLLWSFPCYTHTEEEAARLVNLTAAEALGMNNDNFTNGGLRDYTDPLNNPPYNIMNSVAGTSGFSAQQGELSEMEHNAPEPKPLVFKTLDMTAMFASGGNEYQMHNAYGLYIAKMGKAAVDALDANKRGFLLTRSTFPGSGHYSGHWTGDVQGDWLHMRAGIHASIQNTVNGILYIGDDSCGFVNDESQDQDIFDEMCARWTSVSAFFPFARNHYSKGHPKKHEPWERPVIAAAAKTAIEYRNEITPYMYTLFYKAHMGTGSLVLAAPSFYYPSDATAKSTQDQFMVGPALMVAPALYENMTEVPVYFPTSNHWYDWHTGAPAGVTANPETFASTVDAANVILLFGAGGHVVPKQPSSLTLKEARLNPVSLIAMLNVAGTAAGSIFWDDGEGKDLTNSIVMSYTANATSFEAKVNSNAFTGTPPAVSEVKFYGVAAAPGTTTVTVAGAATPITATYDAALQVLTIPLSGITLSTAFTVTLDGSNGGVTTPEAGADGTEQVPSAGGYSIQSRTDTPTGEKVTLALAKNSTAANVYKNLELEVINEDADRLHVRILATGAENYELPPDASPVLSKVEEGVTAYNYDISVDNDVVTIRRAATARRDATTLVTINLLDLIYNEQYIRLPLGVGANPYIVGLSEHYTEKLQVEEDKIYTMWNTDQYSCPMYTNLYGSHPHYVQITDDGLAHGVYVRNGFGQDWQLRGETLTGHMVGGIVDMYVFTGPTVESAGQQYAQVIGTNFMPPYWSLGWQQSRYGMENISMVQRTIDGYIDQQIPLEVIYTDIDYMDGYKDFTSDPVAFPQVEWRAMVEDVQAKGRKYIIIKDPAISTDFPEYPAYKRGIADDVFVKYADGSGDYHARQWVGTSLVVDPTAANAESWWSTEVTEWWSTTGIPFDGMWIDMNEFANFCQGESNTALPKDWLSEYNLLWSFPCYTHTEEEAARLVNLTAAEALGMNNDNFTNGGLRDYTDPLNNPPYNIMNSVAGTSGFSAQQGELSEMEHNAPEPKPLVFKTLDMTAMFASGGNEYQMHNAYGLYIAKMGKAAVDALDANKRGFLLTRSTFPGSGHYSGHWTGDVQGDWLHMRAGIHASIQNTVNGILYIGDDSCGFVNDESQDQDMFDEMCARWTSVSAFFPFARNHYSKGHPKKHEPWERPVIAAAAKTAIEYRNEITPYMYTLFYKAHMGTGSLVLAAPSFYYPSDVTAKSTQDQFMVGPALMVAPALYENMTEVPVYFPTSNHWYDWHTGAPAGVTANPETFASTVDADNVILLFGAGGHVVPKQPSSLTLKEARLNPVSLIAMLNVAGTAAGSIFWDDGEGKDLTNSIVMSYTASATSFEAKVDSNGFTGTPPAVSDIKFYGITAEPTTTTVTVDGTATPVTATYDAALQVLTIPLTGVTLSTAVSVTMA